MGFRDHVVCAHVTVVYAQYYIDLAAPLFHHPDEELRISIDILRNFHAYQLSLLIPPLLLFNKDVLSVCRVQLFNKEVLSTSTSLLRHYLPLGTGTAH